MKQRLTDTAVKGLKPRAGTYRVTDGGGLCIEVTPAGAKLWRYRYRVAGKASMMSLGNYPAVSLAQARARRDEARKHVADERNPAREREIERMRAAGDAARTFEAVSREWLKTREPPALSESRYRQMAAMLENRAFPKIGRLPLTAVTPADVLACVDKYAQRSAVQARELRALIGAVFRYGVARLLCENDPTVALRGAVTVPETVHHAAIPAGKLGAFLRAVNMTAAAPVNRIAVRLLLLTLLRPGKELPQATWDEIDIDAGRWNVPAARMKMRQPHTVMLSRQAVALLRLLKESAYPFPPVFPSISDPTRSLSYEGVRDLWRRVARLAGVETTPHGARSTFSTWANERGADSRVIELCLAHSERDKVRAAYDHAERLPARLALMQEWADHLDQVKEGARVIPLRVGAA